MSESHKRKFVVCWAIRALCCWLSFGVRIGHVRPKRVQQLHCVQCRKFATLSEHNLQSLPRAITEMRLLISNLTGKWFMWGAFRFCCSPLCLSFWQGVALTTYFRFNYREWGNGIVGKALDVKGVTKVPWGVYQRDLIYRKWIFHFNTQCLKIIHKKVSWRNVTRLPNIVWWRLCTEFHDFLFKKWDQFNNLWL